MIEPPIVHSLNYKDIIANHKEHKKQNKKNKTKLQYTVETKNGEYNLTKYPNKGWFFITKKGTKLTNKKEAFKLHIPISTKKNTEGERKNLANACDIIKDILIENGVTSWKIFDYSEDHDETKTLPGQHTKSIAIFMHNNSKSKIVWLKIIYQLTMALAAKGIIPGYKIPGDKQFPGSNYVYYRLFRYIDNKYIRADISLQIAKILNKHGYNPLADITNIEEAKTARDKIVSELTTEVLPWAKTEKEYDAIENFIFRTKALKINNKQQSRIRLNFKDGFEEFKVRLKKEQPPIPENPHTKERDNAIRIGNLEQSKKVAALVEAATKSTLNLKKILRHVNHSNIKVDDIALTIIELLTSNPDKASRIINYLIKTLILYPF